MGKVLFHWILVGIVIKIGDSWEISDSQSGSKSCNLSLRLNPSPVFFTGYQSLEIFKQVYSPSDYSLRECKLHSVEIRREFLGKIHLKRKLFYRVVTKKHNTNLEVILRHRDFRHLPVGEVVVLVQLDCNGRRCSLLLDDAITRSISQSSWSAHRRKLLSLRATDKRGQDRNLPTAAPVLVAVVGVIVLIVALAMCACGNATHDKALSDEVGGTDVDHHVVAVSSVKIEEGQKVPEYETPVKSKNDNSRNDRRNTNESKKSERNSQSATAENGLVNATGRTASQSCQPDLAGVEQRPRSSGSRTSVDKVEEIPLESSVPEKESKRVTPERKRTASDKEIPRAEKESKDNNYSEARTRTNSSEGAKKSIFRKSSKKRTGSDGKEPESSPKENAEQKKSFWQRRKSSKVKANDESTENISPKKADKKKKKSESQKTPEHMPSSGRHTNLPLPPRPPSVSDEDTQYDVVECRAQRPKSNAEDADYETVTTSKTRTYDKVNVLPKDQSRPSSELYECINDQDTKMKRISSGSNQYDVVETRSPPKKLPVGLEYACTTVAQRDKPLNLTETSAGSGLYEVVTDDIKQKSGVFDAKKTDVVVGDDDYAVVQKDPSKKGASKKEVDERSTKAMKQREKSMSAEIHPAPAPPPVSSLIHVSSSVRRRTQSEGDELNVDSPATDSASDRPKTMVEVDETYAKVNLAMKKRHSEEAPHPDHQFASTSALPEGFYEEAETPPPVPPSLYADLESMKKDTDTANDDQPSSTQTERESEENTYEEVTTTKVEIKSITSTPIKSVSDLKITQAKDDRTPEDPNGVLKKLKSPRNSNGRLSASSLDGDKRFSSGSQHNYDEVLTKSAQCVQTGKSSTAAKSSKDSTSGHYESIDNESKRNSAGYEAVNQEQSQIDADRTPAFV